MPFRETLSSAWKYCLSFRKVNWELVDYPITIREQTLDLDLGDRYRGAKLERYLARIVKWWVLTGGGDTPEEAVRDLAVQFERIRNDWERVGKALPRPGTQVPIEFAPSGRVDANSDLAIDFIQRVFGLDWAFISDGSSLWDFHTNETNDALYAKIKTVYGVDVSDIESGNLAAILERIAASRSQ